VHQSGGGDGPSQLPSQAGFTIVELVVTLVIAAVLLGLAAPHMGVFLRNMDRTTLINDFITGVQYARTQAVTRNQRVTLCPVDIADVEGNGANPFDSGNPAGSCSGDNNYQLGWVVFVDNGATQRQIDGGEQLLRVFSPADVGDGEFEGLDSANAEISSLSFLGTGLGDAIPNSAHFKYCDQRSNPERSARAVLVNVSGQPKVSSDTDDDSIDNLDANTNLVCPTP